MNEENITVNDEASEITATEPETEVTEPLTTEPEKITENTDGTIPETSDDVDVIPETENTGTADGADGYLEALRMNERARSDYSEFSRLFPGVSLDALPDAVLNDVRSGIPPAAAYALFLKRLEADTERAETVNIINSGKTSGSVGNRTVTGEYFSPDEVREMSRNEVRQNLSVILESMSRWH